MAAFADNGDAFFGGLVDDNGSGAKLTVKSSGNVGIGTTAPTEARLVVKGNGPAGSVNNGKAYTLLAQFNALQSLPANTPTPQLSIMADHGILASNYTAMSDARIKTIEGRSDEVNDLATLSRLEVD